MSRREPIILYLRGRVRTADFLSIGDLIAVERAANPFSRILFDWSGMVSWRFQPPIEQEVRSWMEDANFIDRVAIVHQHTWKRQAAWFAALLRTRDCRVRSYHLREYDRALAWLVGDIFEGSDHGDRCS